MMGPTGHGAPIATEWYHGYADDRDQMGGDVIEDMIQLKHVLVPFI